ncbi:MAG: Sir2 silent information regulator family NAD-dependent deacetylase [Bacteroidales bacterium]|nr:Sir2 silent information regulator family NAD-dependent deacetylase [Bacteroidales bacterium]
MTSTASYSERIDFLRQAIKCADHIIIGAGSGFSTAAGLDYVGEDFRREFAPWIERYGITDLYSSSFYPFESLEEYWACWAKHIWFCRYRTGALPLYKQLRELFPKAFVVTTNVDAQFELAGFPMDNIFATQGDYGRFQPANGNPPITWSNRRWVEQVLPLIYDCRIPSNMIPLTEDGRPAAMNLRVDDTFVEDEHWHRQARRYSDFVQETSQCNLLLLEFGIGYNTPGIIRLPFEQMAQRFPHTTLVRFNRDNPEAYIQDLPRFLSFTEDLNEILSQL